MIVYLTGARNTDLDIRLDEFNGRLGLIAQPLTRSYIDRTEYALLGIDNGCFTEGGRNRFNEYDYLKMAERGNKLWGDRLMFVTCPDVPFQWQQTLDKVGFARKIRNTGARAAIVLQNGADVSTVPWSDIDAVFIGGDTAWKLSYDANLISIDAVSRGMVSHMGRVNSRVRLKTAQHFSCHSADGTYLLHNTVDGIDRMKRWFL